MQSLAQNKRLFEDCTLRNFLFDLWRSNTLPSVKQQFKDAFVSLNSFFSLYWHSQSVLNNIVDSLRLQRKYSIFERRLDFLRKTSWYSVTQKKIPCWIVHIIIKYKLLIHKIKLESNFKLWFSIILYLIKAVVLENINKF